MAYFIPWIFSSCQNWPRPSLWWSRWNLITDNKRYQAQRKTVIDRFLSVCVMCAPWHVWPAKNKFHESVFSCGCFTQWAISMAWSLFGNQKRVRIWFWLEINHPQRKPFWIYVAVYRDILCWRTCVVVSISEKPASLSVYMCLWMCVCVCLEARHQVSSVAHSSPTSIFGAES